MLRIAVCDDSYDTISLLSGWIDIFCKTKNEDYSLDTFTNGLDLVNEKVFFDIIFLDIDMPTMNGLLAAKEIRKWDKNVFIIYVTSYADYKNFAFTVHAFGYIQKPIEKHKVFYYLSEAVKYKESSISQKNLCFKTLEGNLNINENKIYYFEFINRKTKIVTDAGEYLSSYALGELFDKLSKDGFDRPHKSFVVNLLHVKKVKGFDIEMMNGDIIPLAQKRAVDFKKNLNDCLQKTFELL